MDTNYIEVETSWSLNITNTITVEAWMKPELLQRSSNYIMHYRKILVLHPISYML